MKIWGETATQRPRGRGPERPGGPAGVELVAPAFDVFKGRKGVSGGKGRGCRPYGALSAPRLYVLLTTRLVIVADKEGTTREGQRALVS